MVFPTTTPTKSFWIEGAKSELRDHRSTPELPKETDVVIIGSGYTGASAAYWLNKMSPEGSTPSMVMLEARGICEGATGRNGGLLRPHTYSRYPPWAAKLGAQGAHDLIAFEVSHLDAFEAFIKDEGLAEEVSYKMSETFDAAMTDEAWARLKGAYEAMARDHGEDDYLVKQCRLIEDSAEAEECTQMKGAVGAVIHPSGQIWAYKFAHALIRIVMKTGRLNLQANTPATSITPVDAEGWILVNTDRGSIRTRKVIHATNRWASQLLSGNYDKLIYPGRGTLSAVKAPEGALRNAGAQHWDHIVNDYLVQLPAPHNTLVIGGAKPVTVHNPREYIGNDDETTQMKGVPEYYHAWPENELVGWTGGKSAEFALPDEEGGVWTGIYGMSADGFPFVGPVPGADGQFISAAYSGHGMPRIFGSTAWLAPQVLESLDITPVPSTTADKFKPLPEPFKITPSRIEGLKNADPAPGMEADVEDNLKSSRKPWLKVKPQAAPSLVERLVTKMSNLVTGA